MRAFTVIVLLAFAAQTHAEDVLADKLADKLLDRAFQADDSDNLDDSTLAKPAQVAVSRSAMLPVGRPAFQLPQGSLASSRSMTPFILNPDCARSSLACFAGRSKWKRNKNLKPQPEINKKENTPLHKRGKLLSAPLSKDLRNEYMFRSMPVRAEDIVKVVDGDYKGTEGKVISVNRPYGTIDIEGITRDKRVFNQQKGESETQTLPIGMYPHKVQITKLYMNKDRETIIKRRQAARKSTLDRVKAAEEEEKKKLAAATR